MISYYDICLSVGLLNNGNVGKWFPPSPQSPLHNKAQHTTMLLRLVIWQRREIHISYPMHSGRRCPARPDGDIRPEAILSTSFGSLRTAIHRQVTCTCQIWIPGWILPHFDVRTISVASKLKKLQIFLYYWQKIFDGTKLDSDGERSSGCECYSWRLIIPAHTLQHCTVGKYFD